MYIVYQSLKEHATDDTSEIFMTDVYVYGLFKSKDNAQKCYEKFSQHNGGVVMHEIESDF